MHASSPRLGGKSQLPEKHPFFFFFWLATLILLMSGAERMASALNQWKKDGLDMMGGADGDALDHLLDDYFQCDEEEQVPGCKQ